VPGTVGAELGVHARRAVQVPRRGVAGPHTRQQRGIRLPVSRWRAITPSVVAGRGDAEHARHLTIELPPAALVAVAMIIKVVAAMMA
jgi:hypothetical protein